MGRAAGAITRTEAFFGDRSHPLIEALRRLDEQGSGGVCASPISILWVAPNGNDLTGDGSICKPFLTVTKAISVAQDGYTIWLAPGTYVESPVVNPSRTVTTIRGSQEGSIIQGTLSWAPSASNNKLELQDITVQSRGAAITATGGGTLIMKNVTASGVTATNIERVHAIGCDLGSSTLTDVGSGSLQTTRFDAGSGAALTISNDPTVRSPFPGIGIYACELIGGDFAGMQLINAPNMYSDAATLINGSLNANLVNYGMAGAANISISSRIVGSVNLTMPMNVGGSTEFIDFSRAQIEAGFTAGTSAADVAPRHLVRLRDAAVNYPFSSVNAGFSTDIDLRGGSFNEATLSQVGGTDGAIDRSGMLYLSVNVSGLGPFPQVISPPLPPGAGSPYNIVITNVGPTAADFVNAFVSAGSQTPTGFTLTLAGVSTASSRITMMVLRDMTGST